MKNLFKKFFALTDQGAKEVIKSSFSSFLVYSINMLPAIMILILLNKLVLNKQNPTLIFYGLCFIVLCLLVMSLSFEYKNLFNATYKESEKIRIDIARNLSDLPLKYFTKHDLTDISQTLMSDVADLEHALSHAIPKVIGFIAFFVMISLLLVGGHILLGLSIIVPTIISFILLFISKKIQVNRFYKYYHKLRLNSESYQEAIELQKEIQSFNLKEEFRKKLTQEVVEGEKIHIHSEISIAIINNLALLCTYLSYVFVIVLGTSLLLKNQITIIYFIGYVLASIKIKDAVDGIAFNLSELFYLDSAVQRINEIRNSERQLGEDVAIDSYDIELKHVSFSYDNTQVLKDISFVAKQNEVTALVGKSGCGKTSILRLISRLYDYDQGEILIGQYNIQDISTKSLFDKVSIVFQDVTLFNDSVMENIRIGNINASDEEVKQAARLANCEEFINKLEQGYDTLIGENGANLSGGERQRLSIARAFLKNAPIIILDEISASLDVINEMKIQESLNKLLKNKTVVIISHRMKSIQNVDKIVVIDKGCVEAIGTHQELLETSPTYIDLCQKTKLAEDFIY